MPDSRGLIFIINERQRRWWLDEERRAMYARADAPPFPVEPQRERSTRGNQLAFRLRMIVRPSVG